MLKTNPRTGTLSLYNKPQRKSPGSPRVVSPPSLRGEQASRRLVIVRTEEERTRKKREEAFQDELMSLGLFGEPQDTPIIITNFTSEEVATELLHSIQENESSTQETLEVIVEEEEFVGPPEPPKTLPSLGKKRGRKKSK
jgi:hypothetical protein